MRSSRSLRVPDILAVVVCVGSLPASGRPENAKPTSVAYTGAHPDCLACAYTDACLAHCHPGATFADGNVLALSTDCNGDPSASHPYVTGDTGSVPSSPKPPEPLSGWISYAGVTEVNALAFDGQVMGKSPAAVKMLVHRGLRKLQERLHYSKDVQREQTSCVFTGRCGGPSPDPVCRAGPSQSKQT